MITSQDFDPSAVPAIRRLLRNMPDLGDYGISAGVHYGAADFDAAEQGVVSDGYHRLFVPGGGNYYWDESLILKRGVTLDGEHKSASVFSFFHNGEGIRATGQYATGGGLRRMSVCKADAGNCVAFVRLQADISGYSPDFFEIDDCNFSGTAGGTASYPILLDGNSRDGSAPNGLKGLRDVRIRGTDVFNGMTNTIEARQCRALSLDHVNLFQAAGACARMLITGKDATKKSTNINLDSCSIGQLSVDYADLVIADGCYIEDVTITANACNGRVSFAFGSVSNNGTNFKISN